MSLKNYFYRIFVGNISTEYLYNMGGKIKFIWHECHWRTIFTKYMYGIFLPNISPEYFCNMGEKKIIMMNYLEYV